MKLRRNAFGWVALWICAVSWAESPSPAPSPYPQALERPDGNTAAELSYDRWQQNPSSAEEMVHLAKALFSKGYTQSGFLILGQISSDQWKNLPEGPLRKAELLTFVEGAMPSDVLATSSSLPKNGAPYRDAEAFQLGEQAMTKKDRTAALRFFADVTQASPAFGEARYLSAALWIADGKREKARAEIDSLLDRDWGLNGDTRQEVARRLSSEWGMKEDPLWETKNLESKKTSVEFALMARGRLHYSDHRYEEAIGDFDKVAADSGLKSEAQYEATLALLALNQPADALQRANLLSSSPKSFESFYRSALRTQAFAALHRPSECREEAREFERNFSRAKAQLLALTPWTENVPDFVSIDLQNKPRYRRLNHYFQSLKEEVARVQKEDSTHFPVYRYLAATFDTRLASTESDLRNLKFGQVQARLEDLNGLFAAVQAAVAQTYLEEREQLVQQERTLQEREETSTEDSSATRQGLRAKVIATLETASETLEKALAEDTEKNPELEFRQSELLWEISLLSKDGLYQGSRLTAARLKKTALALALQTLDSSHAFPSRHQALYFIGYAENELRNFSESERYLSEFVEQGPETDSTPDAFRILADRHFDREQYAVAQEEYGGVLKFPKSAAVGYALYKRAWCAYALQNYARALIGFEQAFQWAEAQTESESTLDLKTQSRKDLIQVYAEVGDPAKALAYFQRFLKESARSWLAELAAEYSRRGQSLAAGDLYRSLIQLNPTATESLIYRTAVLRTLLQQRKWPEFNAEIKALFQAHRNELAVAAFQEPSIFDTERVLREGVSLQHAELASHPSREQEKALLELDKSYLGSFGKWPGSKSAFLLYGALLEKEKTWTEAAQIYRAYFKNFLSQLSEAERESALTSVIRVLEMRDAEEPAGPALTESANELLEACDAILLYYPKSKPARQVAFLRTTVLFKYEQNEKGIHETQRLFDQRPKDEYGKKAFNNLRVAYYKLQQWSRVYQWATQMFIRGDEVGPYLADLKKIREESLFLWAQNEPDAERSAELFQKAGRESQDAQLKQKGFYNAFQNYLKAGKPKLALAAAAELERSAPNSVQLEEMRGVRATLAQAAGDYERALSLLERPAGARDLASATTGLSAESQYNAAVIREALGDSRGAQQAFSRLAAMGTGLSEGIRQGVAVWQQKQNTQRFGAGANWLNLIRRKEEFQRRPLASTGPLTHRVKEAGARLQRLAGEFVALSNSSQTPPLYAFEAYCAVPLLFSSYAEAVGKVAVGLDAALQVELAEIANPLKEQANTLAQTCLSKSYESGKMGPVYAEVANQWGGNTAADKLNAEKVLALAKLSAPFWDSVSGGGQSEAAILDQHLTGKASEQTWYGLAWVRYQSQKLLLSQLTLQDALAKYPNASSLINGLAAVEERLDPWAPVGNLYEQAAKLGSEPAWTNLGLFYLRSGRVDRAKVAFALALKSGVLEKQKELKQAIEELVQNEKRKNG